MKNDKLIITINREYGSGGREIAYKLGALLDIKVYDKNVLEERFCSTSLPKNRVLSWDEQVSTSSKTIRMWCACCLSPTMTPG